MQELESENAKLQETVVAHERRTEILREEMQKMKKSLPKHGGASGGSSDPPSPRGPPPQPTKQQHSFCCVFLSVHFSLMGIIFSDLLTRQVTELQRCLSESLAELEKCSAELTQTNAELADAREQLVLFFFICKEARLFC